MHHNNCLARKLCTQTHGHVTKVVCVWTQPHLFAAAETALKAG